MAVVKDWTSTASPASDALLGLAQPSATRHFDDGDASAWCVHTAPSVYTVLTVTNLDASADLWLSLGPALSGATSTGEGGEPVPAGQKATFVLEGGTVARTQFSTWGEAGAAHAMALRFELRS